MAEQRKRKWGDRRDGRYVKAPGMQTVMGYLYPKRTDCEVYMHDSIDATELMKYLEQKNEGRENKMTIFHCALTAMARMLKERPKMNYFIQGYRMYEHNDITISFVAKRRFADGAQETLMVYKAKDEDTVEDVSKRVIGDVKEARKSEVATGGIDELLDKFAAMPRLLLIILIRIIRWLDFWGINPKFLTDGDPNYTSILTTNLGSIKAPAIYHHLNNYGTNSMLVAYGTLHKEDVKMPDGTVQERDLIDVGVTLDERIADGFYFIRSFQLVKHIFAHPELLDRPLGEPSGYDYKD